MQLSIVIVTYNSKKFIFDCIKSIFNSIKPTDEIEVVVFDNNSNEKLSDLNYDNLKIINNDSNLGLSKSLNTVIPNCRYKTILSINPDVIVSNDTISNLYNYFINNKNVGVAGCRVENFNGEYQNYTKRRFPSFLIALSYFLRLHNLGFTNYYNYSNANFHNIEYVDSISGCCMIFDKILHKQVSGFNENYFLFFEDTQFCTDAIEAGYKVSCLQNVSVKHYGGGSTETIPFYLKKMIFYKSMIIFFIVNIKKYKILLMNCILSIIIIYILLTI